jgi:amino acid transporter
MRIIRLILLFVLGQFIALFFAVVVRRVLIWTGYLNNESAHIVAASVAIFCFVVGYLLVVRGALRLSPEGQDHHSTK